MMLQRLILPVAMAAVGALAGLHSSHLLAQDDFFDSLSVDVSSDSGSDRGFTLLGWIDQKVGYGLESPGPLFSRSESELSRFETSLFAQLDLDIGEHSQFRVSARAYHDEVYRLQNDTTFSADEINEFRNRYEVRDLYLEREFDNGVYVKLGNQILAWGMTEYLRVTDLINIEDHYTFGQQDLEDLRLQVPALLTSVRAGGWNLDAVITYKAGYDNVAPTRDEFDQFVGFRTPNRLFLEADPKRDYEVFMRASSRHNNGDLQIVAGEFNDNALSVARTSTVGTSEQVVLSQNRMRALGVAANWVEGAWLVFGETGFHANKAMRPNDPGAFLAPGGWDRKDQVLGALGVEYSGFRNLLLTAELDSVYTQNNDAALYGDALQSSFGLRAYWTALNERLQIVAVINELAEQSGRIGRVSMEYDWSDNLSLGLLWVNYSAPENSYVNIFSHNDVLQLQVTYNFQIQ